MDGRPVARSLAILCGQSIAGEWGPWSLDETGIGGSEEAVVRLSRQLVGLGWRVTVFATPGSRGGEFSGVEWRDFREVTRGERFDVLVIWRQPAALDALTQIGLDADAVYVWLHDLNDPSEFTPSGL